MEEENILSQLINYMKPKAHDAIDNVINTWKEAQSNQIGNLPPELENTIQGLVMGTMGGGGAGKGLKQLVLALKGKIKGGKMIPSQPIIKGMVGKPSRHSSIIGGQNPLKQLDK